MCSSNEGVSLSVFIVGRFMNNSCGRIVRNMRSATESAVTREQRMNFAPYKNKRNKGWSVKMVCLSSKDAKRIPATAAERELLVAAGLGEKRVYIPNISCSWNEFREEIVANFPILKGCGGFELLRCISNSKELEVIKASVTQSPHLLKQMIGNARVFIRPIQKDLELDDNEELTSVSQVSFVCS